MGVIGCLTSFLSTFSLRLALALIPKLGWVTASPSDSPVSVALAGVTGR